MDKPLSNKEIKMVWVVRLYVLKNKIKRLS